MNFIKHFFSYDFQFYVNRVRLERVDQVFAYVAIACILLAVLFKLRVRFSKDPISKQLTTRLFRLSATVGLAGAAWYGLRYQNVSVLGTHFVFLLLLASGLMWSASIAKYWWKEYKPARAAWEKEQVKLKYLKAN